MDGRGSNSGNSSKGEKYGTKFTELEKEGNIKILRYNGNNAKTPMETMTNNRVYGIVNQKGELRNIVYYDRLNKRRKQIDIGHPHGRYQGEHIHHGYEHSENGTTRLTLKEKRMVERVRRLLEKSQ